MKSDDQQDSRGGNDRYENARKNIDWVIIPGGI